MGDAEINLEGRSGSIPLNREVRIVAGALLVVLATLVVYGPALPGDVLWDDDQYVSDNPVLFAPDGLWRIWMRPEESPQYYPLVFTTFWLEARLWGLSTFGLHLVNVLLHATNALLLWYLLRRLQVPGAWLAGALFALHPVHVESVAWITERKNVLSGVFYLLALAAYLRFARDRSWASYGLALLLFIAALLSKTVTCALPVVLLLLVWWKQTRIRQREVLPLLPFFAVGLAFGLATVLLEKHQVGAIGEEWALSSLQRGLLANRALWFYVGKLLWPVNLVFNYPRWEIDPQAASWYAYPGMTLAAVVLLWGFRRRIGKGPLAALGCFLLGLGPVLGFFNVYYFRYSYVADHFQYHASMAFIALIAGWVTWALESSARRQDFRFISMSRLPLMLPVLCGVLAYRQAALYTDIKTLWQRTIDRNPASWLARYNLALLLVKGHEQDEAAVRQAQKHLEAVLEINPRCADAKVSLGIIAGRRGQHDQAMAYYQAALSLEPDNATAYYNWARELERQGEVAGAMETYRRCIGVDPNFAPAYNGLGRLLLERGDHQGAAEHFRRASALDPRNASALLNLGMVLEDQGRYPEAVEDYRQALARDPRLAQAWFRIGVCRRKTGDFAAAADAYRETLERDPAYADAWADLAVMAYQQGRFEAAAEGYRRALALKPGDTQCRINLVWAYHQLRQYADAQAVLEEGLGRQPDDLALMHQLAKLLVTCPERSLRNGPRAVELAVQVVERLDPPRPEAWGTLAAAYAEVHDHARAVAAAQRALELAQALGLTDLVESLSEQLQEYQRRSQELPSVHLYTE